MLMISRSRALAAGMIVLGLGASSAAYAWDHVIAANATGELADFVPEYVATPDTGGYWAFGYVAVPPAYAAAFMRYDTNGNYHGLHYPDSASTPVSKPVALADGGVAIEYITGNELNWFESDCYIQRFDKFGNFRWRVLTGSVIDFNIACEGELRPDGNSGIWLSVNGTVEHLGIDGAAIPTAITTLPVPDPKGTDVYLPGSLEGGTRATVTRLTESGAMKWQWISPTAGSVLPKLIVADDGNVYAFGSSVTSQSGYAASLSPSGALRWETILSGAVVSDIDTAAVAANGISYVSTYATNSGLEATIHLFELNADGSQGWATPFQPAAVCGYATSGTVAAAPNGDALFLFAPSQYCQQTPMLYRFRPDGSQVYSLPVTADAYDPKKRGIASLADGSTLLVLPTGSFLHIASDGSALDPPRTSHVTDGVANLLDRLLADDGSRYFLTGDVGQQLAVTHFAVDGMQLWRQTFPGYIVQAKLAAGSGLACIVGAIAPEVDAASSVHALCLSASTGQKLWDTTLAANPDPQYQATTFTARILAEGRLVAAYGLNWSTHVVILDAQGHILHDTSVLNTSEYSYLVRINAAGETAIGWRGSSGSSAAVGSDGTVLFSSVSTNGLLIRAPVDVALADDGSMLLSAIADTPFSGGALYAILFDARGNSRWISPPLAPVDFDPNAFYAGSSAITGGHAYLAPAFSDDVFALSLANGSLAWRTTVPNVQSYLPNVYASMLKTLLPDATDSNVLLVAPYRGKTRVALFDSANGAIKGDRFEDCAADNCYPYAAAIGPDGALRVGADSYSSTGSLELTYVADHPFAAGNAIRLDQTGISGAWYPLYSAGQGFNLDYIASAGTIFMPWFTFAQADPYQVFGAPDPSDLRWYGLQGSVAPGTTSADLLIAITDPGSFNSGTTAARIVGSAHLSLSDCAHAALLYQFDSATNGGAGGLISLTRLTPSTSPCTLADGSNVPAQDANPPADGFDARQSGSWYDTATAGQGIEMTIVPKGNGSNGIVFAAWFTFDPAGLSDDPIHQHWFTLQGDLASAANGKVTLPIYRITGGTFDGAPTQNFSLVGQATLTMQGCDAAQFDYQFDTSEVVHAFAGLSGTSHLVKIGGCSAP